MAATHTLPLASPGMARICLYGDLQRFGRRIDLRVKTGAEAIRALTTQLPSFRQKLNEGWYQVRISGRDAGENELSARLNEPLANGAVIHVVPRLAGAKSGGVFQAVLGAALIAVAWWNPVGWLGAAAVSGLYAAGASMILGGVAQMLAPKARTPTAASTDNGKQNTYFSLLANTCTWTYRGDECGYSGPAVADEYDQPTSDITKDKCSKCLSGCKFRNNVGNFGGFLSINKLSQ
ncbi:phage minor tail protein L [Escherichia coli]|uniref:phage minor tail protein L n=1 Tax=Escherichia coli TaxID=562 RepID=UPI0028830803|nr:phage minor tail protein L [Escherichia coli]